MRRWNGRQIVALSPQFLDAHIGCPERHSPTSPRQHEDVVASRVVVCRRCGWEGTYGALGYEGCPYCHEKDDLEVVE